MRYNPRYDRVKPRLGKPGDLGRPDVSGLTAALSRAEMVRDAAPSGSPLEVKAMGKVRSIRRQLAEIRPNGR